MHEEGRLGDLRSLRRCDVAITGLIVSPGREGEEQVEIIGWIIVRLARYYVSREEPRVPRWQVRSGLANRRNPRRLSDGEHGDTAICLGDNGGEGGEHEAGCCRLSPRQGPGPRPSTVARSPREYADHTVTLWEMATQSQVKPLDSPASEVSSSIYLVVAGPTRVSRILFLANVATDWRVDKGCVTPRVN